MSSISRASSATRRMYHLATAMLDDTFCAIRRRTRKGAFQRGVLMSARRRFRARWLLLVWIACAADAAPPTPFSDCPDCPRMVTLPGGTFTMGSPPSEPERRKFEGPQAGVTVATF